MQSTAAFVTIVFLPTALKVRAKVWLVNIYSGEALTSGGGRTRASFGCQSACRYYQQLLINGLKAIACIAQRIITLRMGGVIKM